MYCSVLIPIAAVAAVTGVAPDFQLTSTALLRRTRDLRRSSEGGNNIASSLDIFLDCKKKSYEASL